jgi:hypothetical protein
MKKLILSLTILASLSVGFLVSKHLYANGITSRQLDPSNAHSYSVRFRNNAHYCDNASENEKSGYFDISEQTAADLLAQIKDIKAQFGGETPNYYRCIFGQDESNKTFLMVVATDNSGYEFQTKKFIRQVQGVLPCPTLCEINKSSIIQGLPNLGQSACK